MMDTVNLFLSTKDKDVIVLSLDDSPKKLIQFYKLEYKNGDAKDPRTWLPLATCEQKTGLNGAISSDIFLNISQLTDIEFGIFVTFKNIKLKTIVPVSNIVQRFIQSWLSI